MRGFTLVETLIYTGLVALLLIVIMQMILSSAASYRHSNAYLDVNSTALSAFGRISREIRGAYAVDVSSSVFNATSSKLVLRSKRADGTDYDTVLYTADGVVRLDQNNSTVGDLTPSNVTVSNLIFRLLTASTTTAIRVEMTVAAQERAQVPAISFYGTYVLRESNI